MSDVRYDGGYMVQIHEILYNLKARRAQKYLDKADELASRLEGLFHEVDETPPRLERILLILDFATPQCIRAGIYALHFANQFKTPLYVIHKGILGPLIAEQAEDLDVKIALDRKTDILHLGEIEFIIQENGIDLLITDSSIPIANKLLSDISIPILFAKHTLHRKKKDEIVDATEESKEIDEPHTEE